MSVLFSSFCSARRRSRPMEKLLCLMIGMFLMKRSLILETGIQTKYLQGNQQEKCSLIIKNIPSFCRIKLQIPHDLAAGVAALRAAMEGLVVEVTKDPEYVRSLDPTNERLLNVIRLVSRPSSAGINLMATNPR